MRRDHDGMLWMHTGDQVVIDQEGYLKSELPLFHPADSDLHC